MSLSNFEIISLIGKGSFGDVYKVKRKHDNFIYAMKKVNITSLSDKEKQNALNEIRILASISNPYVISYKESFYSKTSSHQDELCLIMEYTDGGDLGKKIQSYTKLGKHFTESEIWKLFKQICCGLKALHDMNIMHRDLKSENIFLTKRMQCKIGDMNVSKILTNKNMLLHTQTGTPYYASPEIWENKSYSYKSDIWSLGVVLYEMCMLQTPFTGKSYDEVYVKIRKGVYPKLANVYSNEMNYMVGLLLKINPDDRPNINVVIKIVEDAVKKLNKKGKGDNNVLMETITKKNFKQKMIATLKIPNKIEDINQLLPKANYAVMMLSKRNIKSAIGNKSNGSSNNNNNNVRKSLHCNHMLHIPLNNNNNNSNSKPPKQKQLKPIHHINNKFTNKNKHSNSYKNIHHDTINTNIKSRNTNNNHSFNNNTNTNNKDTSFLPPKASLSHNTNPLNPIITPSKPPLHIPSSSNDVITKKEHSIPKYSPYKLNTNLIKHYNNNIPCMNDSFQLSPTITQQTMNSINSYTSNKSNSGIESINFTEVEPVHNIKQLYKKKFNRKLLSAIMFEKQKRSSSSSFCNINDSSNHHNQMMLPQLSNDKHFPRNDVQLPLIIPKHKSSLHSNKSFNFKQSSEYSQLSTNISYAIPNHSSYGVPKHEIFYKIQLKKSPKIGIIPEYPTEI